MELLVPFQSVAEGQELQSDNHRKSMGDKEKKMLNFTYCQDE